jgi:rhodanese-related sulfurtransferase
MIATDIYNATLGETDQLTPEISTEQMHRILFDRSAIVIDTRSRIQFEAGHIPGARNLDAAPDSQIPAVDELVRGDRDAALVLYCNGPHCKASRKLAERLKQTQFANVRRYQLGMAVWRALGGPTAIELDGIKRIVAADRTTVLIDARSRGEFAQRSLPGARNLPLENLNRDLPEPLPLPEDDFNRRIVLFGNNAAQARQLADFLSGWPWHNVAYFPGNFEALAPLARI